MTANGAESLPYDERAIAAEIRQRVAVGDWSVLEEHFDPHRATDGFNLDDVIDVILNGTIVEARRWEDRYLFSHRLSSLQPHRAYRGNALHVVTEWQYDTAVVVVTAYRPLVERWRTMTKRT